MHAILLFGRIDNNHSYDVPNCLQVRFRGMEVCAVDILMHGMCRNDRFVYLKLSYDAASLSIKEAAVEHRIRYCGNAASESISGSKDKALSATVVGNRQL